MSPQKIDRRAIPPAAIMSRWQAPDGWEHRVMDWPQPKGARARGNLLYAGGRGDFIEKYLEALAHWHGQGWNVTAFDWRGQGASRGDIVGGHLDSLDPLVDDLEALIDAKLSHDHDPRVVVGHSMGGHILLRTLAERRPKLDAAVLVAPMLEINSGPLPAPVAPWLAGSLSMLGMGRQPAWPDPVEPPPHGSLRQAILTRSRERYEDELWWWEQEPGYDLGTPSWGWLSAAYRSCQRQSEAAMRSIDTPILILATEKDRLVSAAAIRRAVEALPDAELLMFRHAAHEILRESDSTRQRAHARIDAFLKARAPD
jgi:lysophospholipase